MLETDSIDIIDVTLGDIYLTAQAKFNLPKIPGYGQPCNNCGLCCISEQCNQSFAIFGGQLICPAVIVAPGKVTCGLMEKPEDYVLPEAAGLIKDMMMIVQGVGFGCDAVGNIFDELAEFLESDRADELRRSNEARYKQIMAEIEAAGIMPLSNASKLTSDKD